MIKLNDLINENRPPSPKDVKDWIESFNNAAWVKNAGGYYIFKASKFALKGIKRELKDSGIYIKHFPNNAYGIPVANKNDFHWGTNESVKESKYRGNVLADVIEDIIEDEGFEHVDRVEDSRMNDSTYIYLSTRDMKPAGKIMKTLKDKYGVDDVGYSKTQVAVVVPSGTLMERIDEATHKTYFTSFTGAAEEAAKVAEKEGYQINEDDWFKQVGTGGRYTRSRPSEGDTHRFTVGLLKRGKPARKALHFQVYGMKGGKYELNAYVN